MKPHLYFTGLILAIHIISQPALAQTAALPDPAPSTAPVAESVPPAPSAPSAPSAPAVPEAPPAPRYSAAEIEQAFSYIDADKDGFISREEAAGFKGVARNFDRADLDHDARLSKDEFRNAMNKAK